MPTYCYLCKACNEAFEIRMSIRDKETWKPLCPSCGSGKVEQQLLGFSLGGPKPGPTGCCPPGRCGCHG